MVDFRYIKIQHDVETWRIQKNNEETKEGYSYKTWT